MALDTSAIFKENKKGVLYYTQRTLLYSGILFIAYSLLCLLFIIESNNKTKEANEHFYKISPDLIATFTGDYGRISYTLKKAKEFNESAKIFISGVYIKNSVKTLYMLQNESLANGSIDPNRVEIDYYARNTFENVISTLRYLRKNNGIKEIMVISSDYHIMRIQSLFNSLKTPDADYQIYYYGIKTSYTGFRNIRILYKEVFKLLRTYAFLLFFDDQDLNYQVTTPAPQR
jgi:uncharacterized SAM-binding protein YcdF (DUF218 family)